MENTSTNYQVYNVRANNTKSIGNDSANGNTTVS